jgi:LmbE family N-acetylglucosaminyl deacetylase
MKNQRILVVASHPDDEALGCGGTIARASSEGAAVAVLFMTDGVSAREKQTAEVVKRRRAASESSLKLLGVQKSWYSDFPDNCMDSVALLEIIQRIEEVAQSWKPEVVYTHFTGDLNIDHRLTGQAALTAFRPYPGQSVREIYAFEVASSTEWAAGVSSTGFQPNHFVDITKFYGAKRCALEAYAEEMRPAPHTRSLENLAALAQWRGMSVGVGMAEAFMALRQLV